MEIRQIITFINIIQNNSFSKAAASLGYSQAAVTLQIQSLECELGTKLFERIGKKIMLTPEGAEFRIYATNILNEVNKAKLSLDISKDLKNPLHIGTLESLCFSKLPPILDFFYKNHPKVNIKITIDTPEVLIDMMEHNQLDLIYILDEPRYSNSWKKEMEVKEDIVFVAPANMHFKNNMIDVHDLLCTPVALTEKQANYRLALDKFLASKNISLTPFIEISNTEFIIKIIEQSNAISFLPLFTVNESLNKNTLKIL